MSPVVLVNSILRRANGGRQTSVSSSIAPTQGLVLALRLFNVLINEWDVGTDNSLIKLVSDTKLEGATYI